MNTRSAIAVAFLVLCACGDTNGQHVRLALFVRGSEAREVSVRGGSLTLTDATLRIGPMYLCASRGAELELCATARGEFLDVVSFDALRSEPQAAGTLDAVTGSVRSGFFDYGISWLLTEPRPRSRDEESHSASLRGTARGDDDQQLSFTAEIDVAPVARGDSSAHLRGLDFEITDDSQRLTVTVDAPRWLSRVRFEDLAALDEDGDGNVVIEAGSQAYEAIVQSMTINAVPTLELQ